MLPLDSTSPPLSFSVLMIRFSSFGDVILGTSILDSDALQNRSSKNTGRAFASFSIDALVSKEYTALLEGNPKIRAVHGFDRKSGVRGLFQLAKSLVAIRYDVILDLHQSTRTHLLRCFILFHQLSFNKSKLIKWITLRKPRWRLWGLFCFKGLWPKRFHPPSVLTRIATFLNRDQVTTDLTYLKNPILCGRLLSECEPTVKTQQGHFIVMPSSLWEGKCWETQNFVEVLKQLSGKISIVPVIVGTEKDQLSKNLVQALKEQGIEHVNSVGKWNQKELAAVIGESKFYLGSDTGVSHLSEAMRVPAIVLFGPTSPAVGFAPWLPQSVVVEAPVACRPCGKDGRRCYRIVNPYLCMKKITPNQVVFEIMKLVSQLGIKK